TVNLTDTCQDVAALQESRFGVDKDDQPPPRCDGHPAYDMLALALNAGDVVAQRSEPIRPFQRDGRVLPRTSALDVLQRQGQESGRRIPNIRALLGSARAGRGHYRLFPGFRLDNKTRDARLRIDAEV